MSGKTYLLTGCNSGIGFETLRVLALRGARVIAAARTEERAREAMSAARASAGIAVACELSEPASVRACVETVKKTGATLDGIIANAGIMALPKLTVHHGVELQFLTNHIGHFVLVTGLVDRLAERGRVVVVSSNAHAGARTIDFDNLAGEKSYTAFSAYSRSKLANILFAKELARRFSGTSRTANTLHPGVIATNLTRNMGGALGAIWKTSSGLLLKSTAQGAATQCYVATHPAVEGVSGEYFADCNVAKPRAIAKDVVLAKRLWDESERIAARIG